MFELPKNLSACDEVLAKNVADTLNKHYPGHLWAVRIENSVVHVFNLALSGRWGFVLHKAKIDPEMKVVMRAGGEILERYRVSRGRMRPDEYSALKTDAIGNFEVAR